MQTDRAFSACMWAATVSVSTKSIAWYTGGLHGASHQVLVPGEGHVCSGNAQLSVDLLLEVPHGCIVIDVNPLQAIPGDVMHGTLQCWVATGQANGLYHPYWFLTAPGPEPNDHALNKAAQRQYLAFNVCARTRLILWRISRMKLIGQVCQISE